MPCTASADFQLGAAEEASAGSDQKISTSPTGPGHYQVSPTFSLIIIDHKKILYHLVSQGVHRPPCTHPESDGGTLDQQQGSNLIEILWKLRVVLKLGCQKLWKMSGGMGTVIEMNVMQSSNVVSHILENKFCLIFALSHTWFNCINLIFDCTPVCLLFTLYFFAHIISDCTFICSHLICLPLVYVLVLIVVGITL